jgi:1-acyl-sn-glycerol-3-phosphate acyltransferase
MARHDVYSIPLWGIFPRIWEVIPVRRGEADRQALRGALRVLRAGETVLIAPEGTRSPQLQRGKVGLAYLAVRSQAVMVPGAIEGTPFLEPEPSTPQAGCGVRAAGPIRYRRTVRPGRASCAV